MKELEIYFSNHTWAGQTDCFIVARGPDGTRSVAKPMELIFEPMPEDTFRVEPSLKFGPMQKANGFMEALAHALSEAGYKAKSNETGELAATKLHLKDMQRLVFESSPIISYDEAVKKL